jgi:Flp pilus assembly protein TadG
MRGPFIVADQSGGVLILTALLLIVIIGMAALAIDVGHLMIVRNELRNAADAGALAGTRMLYTTNAAGATVINTDANIVASATTTANMSDASAVEVLTVERGHWCFNNCPPDGTNGVFTPNSSTALTLNALVGLSFATLDTDKDYVNAVRVVAGRGPAIPAASFFAGIWGFTGFSLNAESVAWLGFAGENLHVDFPLAICRESILDAGGNFTCSHGRMINSAGSGYSSETGGWTNLQQPDTCGGAANASEVTQLVNDGCSGNLSGYTLYSGYQMTTQGGQMQSAYSPLYTCWMNNAKLDSNGDFIPDRPWSMTLPMIECGSSNPGPCNTLVGAINVEVLWIINQNDPKFKNVPSNYSDPETSVVFTCPATCTPTAGQTVCASLATEDGRKLCWANFLTTYNVVDNSGNPFSVADAASGYLQKNIIFKPSCSIATINGGPGGAASNVVPKIPKLVK